MTERIKASLPWKKRLVHYLRPIIKPLLKVAVLFFAIKGKYPPLMLTPDDPVSPFGSGTTPGASREPTQMAVYRRFGRYIGDVVWLAWRNGGYGIAYWLKPDWLKDPKLRYMDLEIFDQRLPPMAATMTPDGAYTDNDAERVGTVWVKAPDGKWLWQTTRKLGPLYVITGYRLSAIASGSNEDWMRVLNGMKPHGRPVRHPNMDGRPLVTIRSARTM